VACLVICVAAPAARAGGTYVALGDSVAAPPDSYVRILFDYLRTPEGGGLDTLHNRAVGGEDSSTLRSSGQLATAIADIDAPSDTKLVTIDIGGNDRYACGGPSPSWHLSSCAFAANFDATLADLQAALERDAGPESLAAMTYYNPASGTGSSLEPFYDRGLLGTDLQLYCAPDGDPRLGLDDRIACIAATRGALVADVYPAFKAGGPLLVGDGLHPSACGQAVIAAEFGKALGLRGPVAPPCRPPDRIPPVIRRLELSPRRFVAARRGGSIAARAGAKVTYRLTEAGATRFRVKRAAAGRRVGGECVAPTRRNRDARRCTRYVLMLGAFVHRGHAGANSFRFSGRLAHRRLRPGSYRLVARAGDALGNVSIPARAPFRILP
jgi:lysophospholipase L1-like esterase